MLFLLNYEYALYNNVYFMCVIIIIKEKMFTENSIFGSSSNLLPQSDWNNLCTYNSFQSAATFDKDLQVIDIDNDLLRFKTRDLHENDMLMSPPS